MRRPVKPYVLRVLMENERARRDRSVLYAEVRKLVRKDLPPELSGRPEYWPNPASVSRVCARIQNQEKRFRPC